MAKAKEGVVGVMRRQQRVSLLESLELDQPGSLLKCCLSYTWKSSRASEQSWLGSPEERASLSDAI